MINGKTKVCGLIGDPVEHSLSPVMHNAAFKDLNLNYAYLCFRVENKALKEAVRSVRALNIRGLNVTVPHKVSIIPFLDKLDKTAQSIGAVNAIVNDNGILTGYNTDWLGAINSIKEYFELKPGLTAIVVGAGGGARALVYGLKRENVEVAILTLNIEEAEGLAKEFDCNYDKLSNIASYKADILINATPVGLSPNEHESILSLDQLVNFKAVFDLVYNPLKTKLLSYATEAGLIAIPGLKMLVYQGAAAFELWTKKQPDVDLMYDQAKNYLLK